MANGIIKVPIPKNETALNYAPGSGEKKALKAELQRMSASTLEIPLIIGGREVRNGNLAECRCPHNHQRVLARYHKAGEKEAALAIAASQEAWKQWSAVSWETRVAVFLKAADLLSARYRFLLNAATMLGQSKTIAQAEIDSACSLIDHWRYAAHFSRQIFQIQPENGAATWNFTEWRPLEGFVFAVTPFNFVSIAGNLPAAPAILGNTVLWKPASTGVYPAYHIMRILQEAGLPPGVINFVPGSGAQVGKPIMASEWFAGLHFTGSTEVFNDMWKSIGANIGCYRNYPRIVGETGGKDFIFAHVSADVDALVVAAVRGAFEYQGQKCSAASRMYVPQSIWPQVEEKMVELTRQITVGDVEDFRNFMAGVIDRESFDKIKSYIDYCKSSSAAKILTGGASSDRIGFFIDPTIVVTTDPNFKTMVEEIFGPVLTVFVYQDEKYEETLQLCNETSPYGLTGSVFAQERYAIETAGRILRYAAGNFYINDKPTGALIGHQPFGGARASGTNDKAGSMGNLLRWVSPRVIKENFLPPNNYRYPHMDEA